MGLQMNLDLKATLKVEAANFRGLKRIYKIKILTKLTYIAIEHQKS